MGKNKVYYRDDSHSSSSRDSLYALLSQCIEEMTASENVGLSSRNGEESVI